MREIINLLEEKSKPQDIEIISLSYNENDFAPILSKETIELHYGKLAHGYAEKYNNNEGDRDFNYAGVFLHNMLFPQYREPRNNNKPNGPMVGFIDKYFNSYEEFKDKFSEEAMKLQGSNWIYLATDGKIKTIKNHEVRDDILLLVDWWEHSYLLDYGSDKKKYLNEQWKLINWNLINTRWGRSL